MPLDVRPPMVPPVGGGISPGETINPAGAPGVTAGGPVMRPPMSGGVSGGDMGGTNPNAGGPMHTQGPPAFVGTGMRHMGPGRAAHGAPAAMPHGVLPWSNGGRY